jgi:ABC-2 type transport system permease protein
MQTNIPSLQTVLSSLLRADFTTQWRNRRGMILVLILPTLVVISWKALVIKLGGAFVLSNGITLGLTSIGLMGYSNSIARDRDKGVFQRLRVAPLPTWTIMMSRLLVQCAMIILMTAAVFVIGFYNDNILLSSQGYLISFTTSFVGGAVFLSLGQIIVGLIKNAETVSGTSRLIFALFSVVGMLGVLGVLGEDIGQLIKWSPYGTIQRILSSAMVPGTWDQKSSLALAVSVGYAIAFSIMGIKWFKWNSR